MMNIDVPVWKARLRWLESQYRWHIKRMHAPTNEWHLSQAGWYANEITKHLYFSEPTGRYPGLNSWD